MPGIEAEIAHELSVFDNLEAHDDATNDLPPLQLLFIHIDSLQHPTFSDLFLSTNIAVTLHWPPICQ
jgi:hypothetical protein